MSYKLRYFNYRGKTEAIRYIFALADQEYTDERIDSTQGHPTYSDEWQQLKPSALWGSLPELECDDVRLCQTAAIARYLGTKFGLAGSSTAESAYIDMLITCVEDMYSAIGALGSVPMEKRGEVIKEKCPKFKDWLGHLDKFLHANGDGKGWFVGDSVTIADVYVYSLDNFLSMMYPNILNEFPDLHEMFRRFEKVPKIATWIAKRPKTVM